MRTKPNKKSKTGIPLHHPHNDLYRRFKNEFDILTNADSPSFEAEISGKCYVPNNEIEESLKDILDSNADSIGFLIGRTGIGKSTVIRHTFGVYRRPIVNNNSIIVPFSFNGMSVDDEDYKDKLAAIIRAASLLLVKKFNLNTIDANIASKNDFIDFINTHSPDLLSRGKSDIDLPDGEKLLYLRETDIYSYALEEFKYYLSKSKLYRAVFVVDDIESEEQGVQEKVISSICRVYKCLRNHDPQNTNINVLFSIRPMTEKLIRKNKSIFSAYPWSTPINMKKAVPLKRLFHVRMNYSLNTTGSEHIVKDKDTWQSAFSILTQIVDDLSDKYGYGLLQLFNNNMRRTLVEFQHILKNRFWLQRNESPKAAFRVDKQEFSITQASVFRTLGMRNNNIYPADEGTCLVNCFYNLPENTYDLLMLYIILYLLEKNDGKETLETLVIKSELINDFSRLFVVSNLSSIMDNILVKMEEFKLVEIEQVNNSTVYITLQPRAKQLWEFLAETSILLEMYRDDTYQNFTNRRKDISSGLSSEDLFVEVFLFLAEIYTWENEYIKIFKINNSELASQFFGGLFIYNQVLAGLEKSLSAYYYEHEMSANLQSMLIDAKNKSAKLRY